jgi:hypothetical protein
MTQPVCDYCGSSGAGVQFPLFPRTPVATFGTICVKCDDQYEDSPSATTTVPYGTSTNTEDN